MRRLTICILVASWTAAAGAPSDPDAEFRAQIQTLATARHRVLLSWGTLWLDGSPQPHRFAALGVELGADNAPARAADRTGAYIVEGSPRTFWLIAYPWDATSFHVSDGEGADGQATGAPPWLVLEDTSIKHGLNHNHGMAHVWFGFRSGKLVALADDDQNIRREPETISREFAKDDKCVRRCPQLGTYKVQGFELLRVVGSASTVKALPAF